MASIAAASTPVDVASHTDPLVPLMTRVTPYNGTPSCFLEFGPIQGRALFDTGAQTNHYVTSELVSQLTACPSKAVTDLGFRTFALDPPVERLVIGNVVLFEQAAIIPARFFGFERHPDSSGFSSIDIANESDTYFILPPLPDGRSYPFSVLLSSAAAGSDPRGDRWTTFLRVKFESNNIYTPVRSYPSQTSTESPSVLQLLQKFGVFIDPDTGLTVPDDQSDDDTPHVPDTDAPAGVPVVAGAVSDSVACIAPPPSQSAPDLKSAFANPSCPRVSRSTVSFADSAGSIDRSPRKRSPSPYPVALPVDFTGCPPDVFEDVFESASPAPQSASDAELRARVDWSFITQQGLRPELADEVWFIIADVLRLASSPIPPTDSLPVVVNITTRPGTKPPFRRQPRFSSKIMAQMRPQIDRNLALGYWEHAPPDAPRDCNNMILPVPKPFQPSIIRVVTDMAGVNAITVKETVSTLPKDSLALCHSFAGCTCFSSFDCLDAFYAMRLAVDSRNLTLVTDPETRARYRHTRAPQGERDMCNHCHRVINGKVSTAATTETSSQESYVDDICVGTRPNPSAVDQHRTLILDAAHSLVAVLSSLVEIGQRIKISKCWFFSSEAQFVGFIVDGSLVRHDPARLAPLRSLGAPTDLAGARRLLGVINSRSRFLSNLSGSLMTLNRFVDAAHWPGDGLPDDIRDAFRSCLDAILENKPLHLLDPAIVVHARADSSATAAGGTIGQYDQHTGFWRDIGHYHHIFTAAQRKYSTNIREYLSLCLLVCRYANALRGHRVVGWCDHQNLLYLARSENPRLLRISLTIIGAGIDMSLLYDPGFRMQLEDHLSRAYVMPESNDTAVTSPVPDMAFLTLPVDAAPVVDTSPSVSPAVPDAPSRVAGNSSSPSVPSASSVTPELLHTVVEGLPPNTHPLVHSVVASQQALSPAARAIFLNRPHAVEKRLGNVPTLYLSGRLFIPANATAAKLEFLTSVHSLAHASDGDMTERLRDRVKVIWDSMAADTARFYRSCGHCQHVIAGSRPGAVGRMQPFLYPHPHHTLFIDFYGPLSPCEEAFVLDPTGTKHPYLYLISIVDGYSRFAIYLPSTHKSAAAAVAAYLHWCTFYNPPLYVRTDSDKAFLSEAFTAVLAANGSIHDPVPPYTHHAMGLLERAHKPLGDLLKKLCGHAISEWVYWIVRIIAWRNSTLNRDIGVSPHEALFCRPPTFAYERLGHKEVCHVTPNDFANLCAAMDVCVRTSAAVSSAHITAQFDSERSAPPSFKSGDHVLVHFPDRLSKQLPHARGPFVVLSPCDSSGTYYHCRDIVQHNEYDVHVERLTPFDMSRTSLVEQQQRQLPSRDLLIVTGVDGHEMNIAHGLYQFYVRFYSGYHAWKLYPEVQHLDVVKDYVALHRLNTRKQTPVQQFARITGQSALPSTRPAPAARAPSQSGGGGKTGKKGSVGTAARG